MVSSWNGRESILVGCAENPEKIFKLRWRNGTTLEWVLMNQKSKYPRSNAVAMLIPDARLTSCKIIRNTGTTTLHTTTTTVTPITLITTTTATTTTTTSTTTTPITGKHSGARVIQKWYSLLLNRYSQYRSLIEIF